MSATTIIVNDETPRRQYTASAGQTVFDFPFPFFADGDLEVYVTPNGQQANDTADIQTIVTDYTVSGANTQSGGQITLTSGATAGDIVTILRIVDIDRTADYQAAGDLLAETLNAEQDTEIMISQQLREEQERSIRSQKSDVTVDMTLPSAADRADGVLTFDAVGSPQATSTSQFVAGLSGAIVGANYVTNNATGDGSTLNYTVSVAPGSKTNIQIYIDGVYQNKASFSVSGTTVTFTEAPPLNSSIEFMIGYALQSLTGAASIDFTQAGTGAVTRTVEAKLNEFVSVKDFGAVGDGVTDDTAAIQAALNASGAKVVKLAQGEDYLINTGLTVPDNVILDTTGASITTTATITLITLAGNGSGVVGKGGKLIGPSSSYVAGQKAIYATGTRNGAGVAPTYIDVIIEDIEIDSFGDYAIELLYCSGKVIRPKITNCGYAGVFGYACKELDVIEPHVDTLVGETSSGQLNAYGVTFTGLTTATDTVRDPASTDCKVVGGYIANIQDWHGLDTHGGIRCKFIDNTVIDCRRGIVLTSRGAVNGSEDCVVKGNLVSNNLSGNNAVGNEKTAAAFWDIGNASAKSKRNIISGNKVYQHGGITTNIPAVSVENTEDGCIRDNLFTEPYTSCIKLFSGVARYDINNNTIVDPKGPGTGAGGATDYPQYINITSASNIDITVHGNGLYRKRTSADTVVGQLGIVVANVASKTIDLRSNGFYGVVTPYSFGADRTGITGDVTDEFTGTLTGCTTSPTGTIKYTREGDTVTLYIPDITGTSNSTAATITGLPANCYPADTAICTARITDNGTTSFGLISVTSAGAVNLFVDANLNAFTSSGSKGIKSTTITYKV